MFDFLSRQAPECPRLLVLGLDGLSLDLARAVCRFGRTPHLAGLLDSPGLGTVDAELPELSPVNWTSFYTAAGPEEHGVFGFTRIHSQTYRISLADFSQVKIPTIFDRLGPRGINSRVVNLPNTYPARPIPGMLVSGFVARDLASAAQPPFLLGQLRRINYLLESDTSRGASDPDFLLQGLSATLRSRRAALDLLWPDLGWQCFVLVLTETDRLFHFLLDALLDPTHPRHLACLDFMAEWDALLGHILTLFHDLPQTPPPRLIVTADHGFAPLKTEVDLNAWLIAHGLLHLAPAGPAPDPLDASRILPTSAAFALDPGRIYLHTSDRFARGRLSRAETFNLAATLRRELLSLTWQGQPVLKAVHPGPELYPGPLAALAPDLVCEANPGFDLKAKFDRKDIFGHFGRTGTHTVQNAIFIDSAAQARPLRLRDVGKVVLEHFG